MKFLKNCGFAMFAVFFFYHAIAISVVAPFYKSPLKEKLTPLFGDYLEIVNMDRSWGFYAPEPSTGSILFYETVSYDGEIAVYPLTEAHHLFEHAYFRYTSIYFYLFDDPDDINENEYDESAARYFCRLHEDESIATINFVLLEQKEFTHHDFNAGKRPLDAEFLEEVRYDGYTCES